MAYYLIHSCNQRLWYVKDFLIPSMIKQGVEPSHILIYRDINCIGNLRAWVDSCNRVSLQCSKNSIDGVWHLQDDVVICRDFKEKTEQYNSGIVCGFTCNYAVKPVSGTYKVSDDKIWYSFPCMRIPTKILQEFTTWANLCLWQSQYFRNNVLRGNADDLVFKEWLIDNYPEEEELNLAPNLVNHIDYLIDGSTVNKWRTTDTTSIFWEDTEILNELEVKIEEYKREKLL